MLSNMKTYFFDIEELKSRLALIFSNQLEHTRESFSGNIWFVAGDRKYRVHFDCVPNTYHEAKFYYYGSRSPFNKRLSSSFRGLLDEVYELLHV